jgi:hypothetical protein
MDLISIAWASADPWQDTFGVGASYIVAAMVGALLALSFTEVEFKVRTFAKLVAFGGAGVYLGPAVQYYADIPKPFGLAVAFGVAAAAPLTPSVWDAIRNKIGGKEK